MKSKKSRFWSFFLSFLPGCVEMYMGFMKMGLSLMILFWGIVAVTIFLRIEAILFVALIVWFYSYFHARNLVHMPEGDFLNLEDRYLYSLAGADFPDWPQREGFRKIIAVTLIVFGSLLLLNGMTEVLFWIFPDPYARYISYILDYGAQFAVGGGIIALGVWMIRGRKTELLEQEEEEDE